MHSGVRIISCSHKAAVSPLDMSQTGVAACSPSPGAVVLGHSAQGCMLLLHTVLTYALCYTPLGRGRAVPDAQEVSSMRLM